MPRLRGLKDRRLYFFPGDTPPARLAALTVTRSMSIGSKPTGVTYCAW
nr:hypothetical protein [Mesorhizobium sp. LSJC280B00]